MSHILIGERIVNVCVNSDWNRLVLELATGQLIMARPYGFATIEAFVNAPALLDVVQSVEEVYHKRSPLAYGDLPRQYHECIITTNQGTCTIDVGRHELEWETSEHPASDLVRLTKSYNERHQEIDGQMYFCKWIDIVQDNRPMSKRVK